MADDDLDRSHHGDRKLLSDIRHRPAPGIIHFRDYSHDGHATEFLLEIGTIPCGHHQVVALGVTTKEPHLHALSSVKKPNVPLVMPENVWKALLSGNKPKIVTTYYCGDHGGDTQSELVVSARDGEIVVKAREYSCSDDDEKGKLIGETDQ